MPNEKPQLSSKIHEALKGLKKIESEKPKLPLQQATQPAPPQETPGQRQIRLEDLQKAKFFIATPCYGGALTEPYFKSVLKTVFFCDRHKVNLQFGTIANESLVPRARNTLVAFFMQSDCTHLMFIDADIEFQVDDILRLYAADKDIVVGAYPKKGTNWNAIRSLVLEQGNNSKVEELHKAGADYAINFEFTDLERRQVRVEDGLIPVKDAGTGFMMIKRETIQKMMDRYPELQYKNDLNVDKSIDKYSYALFDTMIEESSKRYLSEDYTFCRLWQRMGGHVYLDPMISLTHYGFTGYPGNPTMIFQQS